MAWDKASVLPSQCIHYYDIVHTDLLQILYPLTGVPVIICPESVDPPASLLDTPPSAVDVSTSSQQPQPRLGDDNSIMVRVCYWSNLILHS